VLEGILSRKEEAGERGRIATPLPDVHVPKACPYEIVVDVLEGLGDEQDLVILPCLEPGLP